MNPHAPTWAGPIPLEQQQRPMPDLYPPLGSYMMPGAAIAAQSTLNPHSAAFSPSRPMPQQQQQPAAYGGLSPTGRGGGQPPLQQYSNPSGLGPQRYPSYAPRGGPGGQRAGRPIQQEHQPRQLPWGVANRPLPSPEDFPPLQRHQYSQAPIQPALDPQRHQHHHFTAYPPGQAVATSPGLLSRPAAEGVGSMRGGMGIGKNPSLSPDQDEMAFDALTKDIWTAAHTLTSSPPKPSANAAPQDAQLRSADEPAPVPPPLHSLLLAELAAPQWGPATRKQPSSDGNVNMQQLLAQLTMSDDDGSRKSGSLPGAAQVAQQEQVAAAAASSPSWNVALPEGEPSPACASSVSQRESNSSHPRQRGDAWPKDGKGERPGSSSGSGGGRHPGPPSAIGSSPTSSATSPSSSTNFQRHDGTKPSPVTPISSPKKNGKELPPPPPLSQQQQRPPAEEPPAPAVAHQRTPSKVESLSSNPSSSAILVEPNATQVQWPPTNRRETEQFLRQHDAVESLRHIKILSYSRQYPEEVAKLFKQWADKGIPSPDDVFGAYYYYVAVHSKKELCMKHNGRGKVPGVGYGGCDFAARGANYKCRFLHQCLFCKAEDHGWFDELKCKRYKTFRKELERMNITSDDVDALVDAYDRK